MKSLELQPSKENLLRTFEQNAIERNIDIFRFVSLLNVIEDNCSIALDGAWGSGKTFFVKQTKMVLDAYNKFIGSYDTSESNTVRKHVEDMQTGMRREPIDVQPEVSVYYDAWSNDNDIDPMLSLVYEILQTVNTDYSFKKGADCLKIAAAIADFFTGKKVTTLVEAFTQTDRLAALKEQKSIHTVISEFLESLLAEQGNRLVIFVDELDRCKPSYAVQLLERIKHYFSNERVTFVFSINTNELQHTVERYYGDNFDSCKYLDRFFDLKLSLPLIKDENLVISLIFKPIIIGTKHKRQNCRPFPSEKEKRRLLSRETLYPAIRVKRTYLAISLISKWKCLITNPLTTS